MFCSYKKLRRRQKLSDQNSGLEITPGDSVVVIGENGKLKKLVVPELNGKLPMTKGAEMLVEILKIFDPSCSIETFENIDKRKLN